MANVGFYAGEDFDIVNIGESGLGFFGSTFGDSVKVNEYPDTTYITNSNGTIEGARVDNVKWTHAESGSVNGAASQTLLSIPNYLATLNIRFTHTSPVQTQNARVRIFDRDNIDNPPSGVSTQMCELIHPSLTSTPDGSGDTEWIEVYGSGSILSLTDSPGESGLSPEGPNTIDSRHDFFVCISPRPDSIGSKVNFGLYFETEYF